MCFADTIYSYDLQSIIMLNEIAYEMVPLS